MFVMIDLEKSSFIYDRSNLFDISDFLIFSCALYRESCEVQLRLCVQFLFVFAKCKLPGVNWSYCAQLLGYNFL